MKIGDYEIPEVRLIPTSVQTLEEIYKVKKKDRIQSKDLAILLGYKYGTEPHFYRKIRSLVEYGLLSGKGIFQISELGEKLLHPRDDQEKALAITNAVLNVPLWKEIYQKHGKKPRDDNFWAVIVDIAKVDPETAKNNATKILGWYLADIGHISENLVGYVDSAMSTTESLRSSTSQSKQMMAQQTVITENPTSLGRLTVPTIGTIEINDNDTLIIARSYLNVLEKKIKERKTTDPQSQSTGNPEITTK